MTSNAPTLSIVISPPILVPWLSSCDRERQLVTVDFDMDVVDDSSYRVDIDVGFNCIRIDSDSFAPRTFFIGSTGAQIELILENGNIRDFTKGDEFAVSYTATKVGNRLSAIKLMPSVSSGMKNDAKASLGSIEYNAQKQKCTTATFTGAERLLSSLHQVNAIKWLLDLHKGEMVVRDYLFGNLYLYAKCEWHDKCQSGTVVIKTTNARLFKSDRQHTGPAGLITSLYILWRENIKIVNNKVELQFRSDPGHVN